MPIPTYLTVEHIIVIHDDQIERYGGKHGIANIELLESAVVRPQASFAGTDLYLDVCAKAAALMHSIALNHPFIDGNKRTALVSVAIFLELNGYQLEADTQELIDMIIKLSTNKLSIKQLSTWIRQRTSRIG